MSKRAIAVPWTTGSRHKIKRYARRLLRGKGPHGTTTKKR